jgi:hypothetical protein
MVDPTAVLVVTMGAVHLLGAVIGWRSACAAERVRARTLVALLRLSGPGAVLADRRPDGACLYLRSGSDRDSDVSVW